MGKKKVQSILKGVAITGTAIGGASVLGDADLVYAQAAEEVANEMSSGAVTVEVTQETTAPATEQVLETNTPAAEQTFDADTSIAEIEVNGEEVVSGQADGPVDSQAEVAEIASTGEEDNEIVITDDELMTQEEYDENMSSLSMATSEFESTSEFVSTSLEAENTALSTAISEAQDNYDANSQSFAEAGFENPDIVKKLNDVKEQAEIEQAKRKEYSDATKDLDSGYYNETISRELARELLRYKLVADGELTAAQADSLELKYWSADTARGEDVYECKNFVVRYFVTDENGNQVYKERYFDYVTADGNGKSLFKGGPVNENDSQAVYGINIVEKKPVFGKTNTKSVTVFGQKMKVPQRIAFEVCEEEYSGKKGNTYFTENEFLADLANYNALTKSMATLAQTITTVTGQLTDLETTAAEKKTELEGTASTLKNAKAYLEAQAKAIAKKAQEALLAQQNTANIDETDDDTLFDFGTIITGVIGNPLDMDDVLEADENDAIQPAVTETVAKQAETVKTEEVKAETKVTQTAAVQATETQATATSGSSSAGTTSQSYSTNTETTTAASVEQVVNEDSVSDETTVAAAEAGVAADNQQTTTYALHENDVPLAVVDAHGEEHASSFVSNVEKAVSVVKDATINRIADENVAKGHMASVGDAGRKGFMFGLIGLLAAKFSYDKYKSDTNPKK